MNAFEHGVYEEQPPGSSIGAPSLLGVALSVCPECGAWGISANLNQ